MPKKELAQIIELAGEKFNAVWLRSVSEQKAVTTLQRLNHNQVRNAHKQANGLSVRNHTPEGRAAILDKQNNKPQIIAMAKGMDIEFEGDANKSAIIDLIIEKENE